MDEEAGPIDDIMKKVFASPSGRDALQWLSERINECYPVMVANDLGGGDPLTAAYRDGRMSAFKEILEMAGYRITYERMPDERDDNRTDEYDTDAGSE